MNASSKDEKEQVQKKAQAAADRIEDKLEKVKLSIRLVCDILI